MSDEGRFLSFSVCLYSIIGFPCSYPLTRRVFYVRMQKYFLCLDNVKRDLMGCSLALVGFYNCQEVPRSDLRAPLLLFCSRASSSRPFKSSRLCSSAGRAMGTLNAILLVDVLLVEPSTPPPNIYKRGNFQLCASLCTLTF